ncbi:MAG: transketolase [Candidatus Goldbacteria bacterium]|nr:transketolase [Candidatus Goldiibacteriota bacterium]
MEILEKVHYKNLIRWAKDKKDILVLSADLTSSCEADGFRDTYPDRFISCGIAEQNMLSVAGGLAREGFIPFVHTFAVFIYRRAYDQIAMSVAYPCLPVKMFGFLPGITTPGGATHQAIEDISIMRSLPNMTIIEVGDATEVENVLDLVYQINGPVYVRMLRGQIPRLFSPESGIKLDTPKILSDGSDILVFSSGVCTEEAMRAVAALKKKGISVGHIHISTLKPFNNKIMSDVLSKPKYGIITIENHSVIGGLGTIISEKMVEHGINKKLIKLGINDTFSHGASKQYLMKEYKIDALSLIEAVENLINNKLNIKEDDLQKIRIEPINTSSKAEIL